MRRLSILLACAALVAVASPLAAQPAAERRVLALQPRVLDIRPRVVDFSDPAEASPRPTEASATPDQQPVDRPARVRRVQFTLASSVPFAEGSAQLSPRMRSVLDRIAARLRRFGPGTVVIVGHTDSRGSAVYNQGLSERRAQAVERYLARRPGLGGYAFFSRGVGESEPRATNATARGRAQNRRVTISFSANS